MQTTYAVCAPGVSLTPAQVEQIVEAGLPIVAAGDAIRLTHRHAVALAATDARWWRQYPEWQQWPGRRFTLAPNWNQSISEEVERLETGTTGTNSGLFAIQVAKHLGALRALLVGFDLHSPGEHFFGKHPPTLNSSNPSRFAIFQRQFLQYKPRDLVIINCTPGSALLCYEQADLTDMLAQSSSRALRAVC